MRIKKYKQKAKVYVVHDEDDGGQQQQPQQSSTHVHTSLESAAGVHVGGIKHEQRQNVVGATEEQSLDSDASAESQYDAAGSMSSDEGARGSDGPSHQQSPLLKSLPSASTSTAADTAADASAAGAPPALQQQHGLPAAAAASPQQELRRRRSSQSHNGSQRHSFGSTLSRDAPVAADQHATVAATVTAAALDVSSSALMADTAALQPGHRRSVPDTTPGGHAAQSTEAALALLAAANTWSAAEGDDSGGGGGGADSAQGGLDEADGGGGAASAATAGRQRGRAAAEGTLWFKVERVVHFLQVLWLARQVPVDAWPPVFTALWGWSSWAATFARTPLPWLLRWAEHRAGYTLPDGLSLWHYRSVVGYTAEAAVPAFAVFVLLHVLSMPDYADPAACQRWERLYLTHWYTRSLLRYLAWGAAAAAIVTALRIYGDLAFPEAVVAGAAVSLAALASVLGGIVVALSFAIHLRLRDAARHDAKYSFGIMVRAVVAAKVRLCLLVLSVIYLPVSVSVLQALAPMVDWNDTTAIPVRARHNFNIACYYAAFPPQVLPGSAAPVAVMDCASRSGLCNYALSSVLLALYLGGLPALNAYLARLCLHAFRSGGAALQSFQQARDSHSAAEAKLHAAFPAQTIWLERRRLEAIQLRQSLRRGRARVVAALRTARRRCARCSRRADYAAVAPSTPTPAVRKAAAWGDPEGTVEGFVVGGRAQEESRLLKWLRRVHNPDSALVVELRKALEEERHAYQAARADYILALADFECMHTLEITESCAVVDTAGLLRLVDPFDWRQPLWRRTMQLEQVCLALVAAILGYRCSASAQLLGMAAVLSAFAVHTARTQPFLHEQEARLDSSLRSLLLWVTLIGAAQAGGMPTWLAAAALVAVTLAAAAVLLRLADLGSLLMALAHGLRAFVDSGVEDLLFSQVHRHALGLETGHEGVLLLSQWDDLLQDQRWSGFMAWPAPVPGTLLSLQNKVMTVRWAALRGLSIDAMRTSTTLSLLHDAFIRAEVEAARWLMHHHPQLLASETVTREGPVYLGLLEMASTLLRLADEQATAPPPAHDNVIMTEARWKAGQFLRLFLSPPLRAAAAPIVWDAHQYAAMGARAGVEAAELAQHLAEAFDLNPPRGYSRKSRWAAYAPEVQKFLAAALCACQLNVSLVSAGLGDSGLPALRALCHVLAARDIPYIPPSLDRLAYPVVVRTLDLRANRLGTAASVPLAAALHANRTLEAVDLSDNDLDSDSAAAVALAVAASAAPLATLSLADNRIGPEAGPALAQLLRRARALQTLNVGGNSMEERRFWDDARPDSMIVITGAGEALGLALGANRGLIHLGLTGCRLGPEGGIALAAALERPHRTLTRLDLGDNMLLPEGGKAIAMALSKRGCAPALTHLDLSRNKLGSTAGKLLAAALKRARCPLRALDAAANALGPRAALAIAAALRSNAALTELRLADNAIGPAAAGAFGDALAANKALTALDLSRNGLGDAGVAAGEARGLGARLGRGLRSNAVIAALDLSDSGLDAAEVQALCSALVGHPSLRRLRLGGLPVRGAALMDVANLLRGSAAAAAAAAASSSAQSMAWSTSASGNIPGASTVRFQAGSGTTLPREGVGSAGDSGDGDNTSASVNGKDMGSSGGGDGGVQGLFLDRSAIGGDGAELALMRAVGSAQQLAQLDLRGNAALGAGAAVELAAALLPRGGLALHTLDLGGCALGDAGGAALARALGEGAAVTSLSLCTCGLGPTAGAALAAALRVLYRGGRAARPCRLTRLDISGNALGAAAGCALVAALINDVTVHLDMSATGLGADAGAAIARLLRNRTAALRHLRVARNTLAQRGADAVFWALRRNAALVTLDLTDNQMGPGFGTEATAHPVHGTSVAAAMAMNETLRHLCLGDNALSAECCASLAEGLERNRSLQSLRLAGNGMDDVAAVALATKLSSPSCQLTELDVSHNQLGWRGGLALARALAVNARLRSLSAAGNAVGAAGAALRLGDHLASALAVNCALTALDLSDARLGPAAGVAIAGALARNGALVRVDLRNNRFDQDVGIALEAAVRANATLVELRVSPEEATEASAAAINGILVDRERAQALAQEEGAAAASSQQGPW